MAADAVPERRSQGMDRDGARQPRGRGPGRLCPGGRHGGRRAPRDGRHRGRAARPSLRPVRFLGSLSPGHADVPVAGPARRRAARRYVPPLGTRAPHPLVVPPPPPALRGRDRVGGPGPGALRPRSRVRSHGRAVRRPGRPRLQRRPGRHPRRPAAAPCRGGEAAADERMRGRRPTPRSPTPIDGEPESRRRAPRPTGRRAQPRPCRSATARR